MANSQNAMSIVDEVGRIRRGRDTSHLLIALDGLGGAGKSTLAQSVSKVMSGIQIVHMDDFLQTDVLGRAV